ncbi:diguanylate cyclase [Bordetella sp. 02P26C-1]|uniref:diguanylate cyclase n=1 Tax=Bordetella sp. 02P26C-1 TaxID=2683195 RepID=UPI001355B68F|nr:diguanylate cyclase [Bordetella sp. 02P26C-1]MVW77716.1 diguanylate cyclase [Bordetella sp. 02P26C-1]
MDILETITAHTAALRLPLFAVTVSATRKTDTPLMLVMHWHGFRADPDVSGALLSVAGSAVQVNQRWDSYAAIDRAMLDAGWRLGAWEVERIARPAWWRLNAPDSEALACRRAFADYSDTDYADEAMVVEAPDHQALLDLAARRGYVRWLFRPRKGGVWSQIDGDDGTLDADGGRSMPCPVAPQPDGRELRRRVIYRLGHARQLLI